VIGYGQLYPEAKVNPIGWILNHLAGSEKQSAQQETITNAYLEGGGLDLTKPLDFSSKKRKFSL
jgi:ribonucleotide reductase beta subunit family protein with ferritin-like domain